MEMNLYLILGLFGVNIFAQALDTTPSSQEQCGHPMDEGTGEKQDLKFYYSKEKKVCEPFHYKGIGGNDNRFNSDMECMEACSENYATAYPDGAEVCELPEDYGRCKGRLLKFSFNAKEGMCRAFLYSGCGGNGNRFETREKCLQTCQAKSGRSGAGGSESNPDAYTVNSGLIAGVLGGCIFAVAIVSAAAVFIKNKTNGRKKVPTKEIEMS
ncbi:boophilin-G2 isoform X1 [Anguilla rostrata]|uniref:boophilin-G2 isoform X1 n=1 Tax=Anguilla rostrata TaxID=7938 RepID=UPI0030CE3AF1